MLWCYIDAVAFQGYNFVAIAGEPWTLEDYVNPRQFPDNGLRWLEQDRITQQKYK